MTKKKTQQPEAEAHVPEQTAAEPQSTETTQTTEAAAQQPQSAPDSALEAMSKERDEYLNLAQRVQADFDNYRRRNQSVRQDSYDEGVRDALTKLLPVLDNLERAGVAQGSEDAIREGVQMVLKQTLTILESYGVKPIEAEGGAFDPNLHNAVMQEAVDGMESGTVVQELQKGYAQGERVLRYSMVKVAQ